MIIFIGDRFIFNTLSNTSTKMSTTATFVLVHGSCHGGWCWQKVGKEWLVSSYEPQDFGVTNPDDIVWMNARLGPMSWHTHDQPLKMQNTQSKKLAKSYISCTDFGTLNLWLKE
jgi:hypothetical protein